ncbi:bile acid:sodium symporter family protein [Paraurantiacibacter namhicola]|uniref:Sodium Bile acid symporter family protein n=1 Tax=Paraurantiacibacter namhicola TaxID=645517 RepID=A0A1C7D8V4_9SPHN|nr:bile acid:sodium symporter family protein [Paraurantiacibacter namhicola]ANU07867.1 hypothetical protein A6F65_01567 [Paraurantiacibacter namhicola]
MGMMQQVTRRIDPLMRMLVAAILLASLLPVSEALRPAAQAVSDAAIFLLFLLNGLRLPRGEVLRGLKHRRYIVPVCLFVFAVMGMAGLGAWQAAQAFLPPLVALGFLFLGVLPSTVQSATAYTSLSGGSVAMSVIAAALLNLLAVFVTIPLFTLLAGGQGAGLDFAVLQKVALVLLLPFILGQLLQGRFGAWAQEQRVLVARMDRSAIAIAVYVAFSGAVREGLWERLDLADWAAMGGVVAVLLALGFGGSWALGGALRLERAERISFLFAGAHKSMAMGAPLAAILFDPAQAGMIMLPLLVYHLAQMLVSAPLASRFSQA